MTTRRKRDRDWQRTQARREKELKRQARQQAKREAGAERKTLKQETEPC